MRSAVSLYGIKNCDTVKKARSWLDGRGVKYTFHDFKEEAPTEALLRAWVKAFGWEVLLNKAGTTFRGLPETEKARLDEKRALVLMLKHPTLIKRPVLVSGRDLRCGFKPEVYSTLFS